MSNVLDALRTLNSTWFPIVVFPTLTVAALSAMYSTADTCVSAVLYLVGYSRYSRSQTVSGATKRLPSGYFVAMLLILFISLSAYVVVRVWFTPTILQLVFSVYSNLIVLAPTVLTTTFLRPCQGSSPSPRRTALVVTSLLLGTATFWGTNGAAIALGEKYLWLSQLSLTLGLIGAVIPLLPVWFGGKQQTNNIQRKVVESEHV